MTNRKLTTRQGFTLVELMVSIAIAAIVIFGIGVILVDSQRGWHTMYNRVYSDVVTDGYVARKMFDSVIRRASSESLLTGGDGSWLEAHYYADPNSTAVDSYAYLYVSEGDLNVEYGKLNPRATITVGTACRNVSGCTFKTAGNSAQMILTLDDGSQTATVTSSAVAHN